MTHDELVNQLAALEQHLSRRCEVWRIVVDENGQPTGQRIYRGAIEMPPTWEPPSFETLMASAKGRSD